MAISSLEYSLLFISFADLHLIVGTNEVQLVEPINFFQSV